MKPPVAPKIEFATDSSLEEAVLSELVSAVKFPVSRENTGNFVESRLDCPVKAAKRKLKSSYYDSIPYASKQGILASLSGN
jgi:hypothetical protein